MDTNGDGRLDITCGVNCYEAPLWKKRPYYFEGIAFLHDQIEQLRSDDLDYQSEQALTFLGRVVAEQERFELFPDLARHMGSREWGRSV